MLSHLRFVHEYQHTINWVNAGMISREPLTREPPTSGKETHHEPSVVYSRKQPMTPGKPAYDYTEGLPTGLHARITR
jgi:hypothetical protein